MWFESLLVLILFKFKKRPNISGIRVVHLSHFGLFSHKFTFRSSVFCFHHGIKDKVIATHKVIFFLTIVSLYFTEFLFFSELQIYVLQFKKTKNNNNCEI